MKAMAGGGRRLATGALSPVEPPRPGEPSEAGAGGEEAAVRPECWSVADRWAGRQTRGRGRSSHMRGAR